MLAINAKVTSVVLRDGKIYVTFEGSRNVKAYVILGKMGDELTFHYFHAVLFWGNARGMEEVAKSKPIVRIIFQDKHSKESTKYVPVIRAIGDPIEDEFIILGKPGFYTQDEVFELLTRPDAEGTPPEAKLDPRERVSWSTEYLAEKPDIPLSEKPNPFGIKSANPTGIDESSDEEQSPDNAKAETADAESETA